VEEACSSADVRIDGTRPWDIRVEDERFFRRLVREGDLGFGESYMDGWWDCEQIDEMVARVLCSSAHAKFKGSLKLIAAALYARIFNEGSRSRQSEGGVKHYDQDNDLFQCMLGRRVAYSCGYWKDARTLDEAQEAKLGLICEKLRLKPGMRILDIGCGWGSLLKYAAEKHGVEGVGITINQEHVQWTRESCKGLPVEIRLQDYRDLNEPFDRIASVEMFEHVCHRNYRKFMQAVRRCLNDDGLFLLQTMGGGREWIPTTSVWMQKYFFPVGELPSVKQISSAAEGLLVMEDWHNFGNDYVKTLRAWFENLQNNRALLRSSYDDRFYRMWRLFLLGFAGTFLARWNQLWQIVFSKRGIAGGYPSIR
jgi:cyclopropane-fatty-acyl-phospholipid synthase